MRALVETCLRQRFVVVVLAGVLVVLGARVASDAPFDAFPEFAPPRIEIQTEAPGLSSEEVEALITTPLEAVLAGTPRVSAIRSRSVLGLSSIVLLLEPGADLVESRMLVAERLARGAPQLPLVARPPVMLSPLSSTSRVLKIGVWSSTLSQMELTDLARWIVRPRLMRVPGVANVAIWGERDRQLQVRVDPERLAAAGVAVDRVIEATREAVAARAGGLVDEPNQRLPVLHTPFVRGVEELARVPVPAVATPFAAPTLGEIAEVVEDHPPAIGDAVVTGGAGLLLIVEKQPGANTLEVTHGIDAALVELAPAMPGVETDATIFRPAGFIERALSNLGEAMAIGCALVIAILFFFLWDWRAALVSVTAIPLSLLAAAAVLTLTGRTLDTMVIAGLIIALGEVVDDAIIDVENIHRRLREDTGPRTPARTLAIVLRASLEVRSAVVYASLIVVLVFVPVLFLEGVAGEFFRPLAIAYGLAVLASMLVALTITPALAMILLPNEPVESRREPPLARRLARLYEPVLARALARPRAVLGSALFAVIASIACLGLFREEFLPQFAENDFLMHWIGRPGTSLEAMARVTERARGELLTIPGVRNFGAHIGRAEVADEVVGPNFAELWISVDPEADLPETMARVRETVDGYPGLYRDVQTYLQERMREVLSGGSGAIVVRLYGPDVAALRATGAALAERLDSVPGVEHASPESHVLVPEIEITPRAEDCTALGVDPGLVRRRASMLVSGERVGQIVRGQQPVDVLVWSTERSRSDLDALRDLPIAIDARRSVRLGDVADVRLGAMPNTIAHDGGSRKLDVTLHLAPGADLGAIAVEVDRAIAQVGMPAAHHAEVLGEHAARAGARERLVTVGAIALLGVFLVLLADFRAPRLALLVLLSLPFALVGGVAVTALGGGAISLGTLVGFVTVLGIAARNGILLISHYRHLEDDEGVPFGTALIVRGALERLSPILMTALATGLALVPLVVSGADAGHEIEHPMAIVILGGLASSTLLNLLVMPVVYARFGRRSEAELAPREEVVTSETGEGS